MEFTLKELANIIGGDIIGDEKISVVGISSLGEASPGEISFFADRRYEESLKKTEASAIMVSEVTDLFDGPQLVVPDTSLAYARVTSMFAPKLSRVPGVSDRAVVHETTGIGNNVSIYPLVYVGSGAAIGNDVTLFSGVFIGDRVKIGDNCGIYPNVTVMNDCIIGDGVIIHAGSVIGSDGFGFARDGHLNVKIPQMGIVQIDDNVELGANNCIDRAAFGKTWIKRGVKTDNMVHIGHNVTIGEDTIIVAQTVFAGSAEVGREVVIGGQVAVSDHVSIGDRVMIGSQSGVPKSIPEGEIVSGTPVMPHRLWLKTRGLITRLPQLYRRFRGLEKKIRELETRLGKQESGE